MQKQAGVIAVVVFLLAIAFPFLYNLVSIGLLDHAGAAPRLKIDKPGQCVESTEWMRHNHMKMLLHVREDSVREGVRLVNKSLHGCRNCHASREDFCDQCHDYVGVEPECWGCHTYPLRGGHES